MWAYPFNRSLIEGHLLAPQKQSTMFPTLREQNLDTNTCQCYRSNAHLYSLSRLFPTSNEQVFCLNLVSGTTSPPLHWNCSSIAYSFCFVLDIHEYMTIEHWPLFSNLNGGLVDVSYQSLTWLTIKFYFRRGCFMQEFRERRLEDIHRRKSCGRCEELEWVEQRERTIDIGRKVAYHSMNIGSGRTTDISSGRIIENLT